jgi:outer membrane protein assembly factor BamB
MIPNTESHRSPEGALALGTGETLASGPQVITLPRGAGMADVIDSVERQRALGKRRVDMTPVIENGAVLIGSGDHSFYSLDAKTGKKNWSYVAGPGMAHNANMNVPWPPPLLKNGTVYFVTEEGLHALETATGKRKWLFETLREIPIERMNMRRKRTPEGPVMGDGVIALTAWPFILGRETYKSFVYVVEPDSGAMRWSMSVDGLNISAPTLATGLLLFAVEERATSAQADRVALYALDITDGRVRWKSDAEGRSGPRSILVSGNTVCSPPGRPCPESIWPPAAGSGPSTPRGWA